MSASHAARRLAWRELRRRKGRTALVVALVALPVLALVVGASIARTAQVPEDLRVRAAFGGATASVHYPAIARYTPRPVPIVPVDEAVSTVRRLVPEARVVTMNEARGTITGPAGTRAAVRLVGGPANDPLVAPRYEVEGRLPVDDDELALGPELATILHTGIGQDLSVPELELTGRVVGLAHPHGEHLVHDILVPRMPAIDPAQIDTELLIELPDALDERTLRRLADTSFNGQYDLPQFTPTAAARLWPNDRACVRHSRTGCSGFTETSTRPCWSACSARWPRSPCSASSSRSPSPSAPAASSARSVWSRPTAARRACSGRSCCGTACGPASSARRWAWWARRGCWPRSGRCTNAGSGTTRPSGR